MVQKLLTNCIEMPVPASYNEINTGKFLWNHVDWIWYERGFQIHRAWMEIRMVLRVVSVTHHSVVHVTEQN